MEAIDFSPPVSPDSSPVSPDSKDIATEGQDPQGYKYLMKQFQVEEENERASKAYAKIWEWAKTKAESKDRDSVVFEVLRLNRKLGSGGPGTRPWTLLENYVTTYNTAREAEKRLQELEGRGTL